MKSAVSWFCISANAMRHIFTKWSFWNYIFLATDAWFFRSTYLCESMFSRYELDKMKHLSRFTQTQCTEEVNVKNKSVLNYKFDWKSRDYFAQVFLNLTWMKNSLWIFHSVIDNLATPGFAMPYRHGWTCGTEKMTDVVYSIAICYYYIEKLVLSPVREQIIQDQLMKPLKSKFLGSLQLILKCWKWATLNAGLNQLK